MCHQLGIERLYNGMTGQHNLREETNRNGELLRDFAYVNSIVIMSTNFQHKRIHKKIKTQTVKLIIWQ
jgi:hypothetical protein